MATFNPPPAGPIQFWLVRNSPGCNVPPRTPRITGILRVDGNFPEHGNYLRFAADQQTKRLDA